MGRLEVRRGQSKLLQPTSAELELALSEMVIDADAPARSRAHAKGSLALGSLRGSATLDKSADAVAFELQAKADDLGLLPPLLPPLEYEIPFASMSAELESRGSVRALFGPAPVIDHKTRVQLAPFSVAGRGLKLAAEKLHAQLDSRGTARRHELSLALQAEGAQVQGHALGAPKVALTGSVDLAWPRAELSLKSAADPDAELSLKVAYDRGAGELHDEVSADLRSLGKLRALLPASLVDESGVDVDKLAVSLRGKGDLRSAVLGFDKSGMPLLQKDPLAVRGQQALDFTLGEIHGSRGEDAKADVSRLELHTRLDAADDALRANAELDAPQVHATFAGLRCDVAELRATAAAALATSGAAVLNVTAAAKQIDQTAAPSYPVGGLSLAARVDRTAEGGVRLSEARLQNAAGGTTLELGGGIDLMQQVAPEESPAKAREWLPGRRSLSVTGTLVQDLAALNRAPDVFQGSGRVSVPFRIESGDLAVFRAVASMGLDGVSASHLPSRASVKGVQGRVTILQDFLLDPVQGVVRLTDATLNAYSKLRFADHQPFLSRDDFVAVESASYAGHSFGPLAANLRIDRNVVSLDQLEMQLLGGKVTGQLIALEAGPDTSLAFRGDVTGMTPAGTTDRLDANAAFSFLPEKLELEGRVEIVRIGKQNLLDLLDVWDPYHAIVSANRARLGLKFGYPKQVRLLFRQGFASLGVELGGLAGAVSIEEIRGIPLGPMLQRYAGPYLRRKEEPQ
jgi:hypothetical protein